MPWNILEDRVTSPVTARVKARWRAEALTVLPPLEYTKPGPTDWRGKGFSAATRIATGRLCLTL